MKFEDQITMRFSSLKYYQRCEGITSCFGILPGNIHFDTLNLLLEG